MNDANTKGPGRVIRKAVIQRIARDRRCSLAVAAHIYACKSIPTKERLCAAMAIEVRNG